MKSEVCTSSEADFKLQTSSFIRNRRMMNHLDLVAVGIAEITGPCAVAVGARLGVDDDAVPFEERRPLIDGVG